MSFEALDLETSAIVLTSVCSLFGAYSVLFVLALWATINNRSPASHRLQVITALLYVTLTIHTVAIGLQFSRTRRHHNSTHEHLRWEIPLVIIRDTTATLAGLLADGLLAWRFYVVYGRQRWAAYIPAIFVVMTAGLGLAADLQHFAIYANPASYEDDIISKSLYMKAAWGWSIFVVNTALTAGVAGKIITVSRSIKGNFEKCPSWPIPLWRKPAHETACRALVEGGALTWVGLLLYEICALAPTGRIATRGTVGHVMYAILPIFFGISQTVTIFRLGLSGELSSTPSRCSTTSHVRRPMEPLRLIASDDGSSSHFDK